MNTNADYISLIDMTPSGPGTIMTAWSKAKVLTTESDQNFTVFVSDLPLFRVAVDVVGHTLKSLAILF